MEKSTKPISDAHQREQALDPTRSFIVQAPAGSGKTELLIQRYLKLLATVGVPEEIIAITFTRKAAAEMRSRVLEALSRGKNDTPPAEPHARTTWLLARDAIRQNEDQKWQISENPSRLKIQTIDSLCAGLTRQMPFLSGFGAHPRITDRPEALYRKAARNTVADLEAGLKWSPAIEALARHLDNHLVKVENLIAGMLSKRDQWLRHMVKLPDAHAQRKALEKALKVEISEALQNARDLFPKSGLEILLSSARFAAENLKKENPSSFICACEAMTALPGASSSEMDRWLGLSELLLTQKGGWRKRADKNTGFPAPGSASDSHLKLLFKENKKAFADYLQNHDGEEQAAAALNRVRILPAPAYTDDQWAIMQSLFVILKAAVGHLELVFKETGQVDFAEMGLRAVKALGEPDDPTDLSLALDYRISHILMDEFQDTSFTQFEIIERLTAGWIPGDGRTFFAVGDPMQSIYGFREAEVGLFLNAWESGLGAGVPLTPLTLSVNFRSQQGIIDWVNESFIKIMPESIDPATGRVSYTRSESFHPLSPGSAVEVHPLIPADSEEEAETVLQVVKKSKIEDPAGTIAILVRSRYHLSSIVAALKKDGIKFQAVEIDSLKNRPVITDLISLTRALSHPADRIAWLAVLRAPWCGMSLEDMFKLVDGEPDKTILELIIDPDRRNSLSAKGKRQLQHVCNALLAVMDYRHRKSLRRVVEGAWSLLGGPACVFGESEFKDVEVFFDLLEQHTGNQLLTDIKGLEDAAAALFARPDIRADDSVQIMTIHKAKGLEFDRVILPGLEKSPPSDPPQLLLWMERTVDYEDGLLLAPISETGTDKSKTYQYIQKVQNEKRSYEDARLLYVAATRAKKKLYIFGGVKLVSESREISKPSQKSLLNTLWPAVSETFYKLKSVRNQGKNELSSTADLAIEKSAAIPYIRRFKDGWKIPEMPPDIHWKPMVDKTIKARDLNRKPEFDWAGETARHVGIVVHAWLRIIGEQRVDKWNADKIQSMEDVFKNQLRQSGVSGHQIDNAADSVRQAIINTLDDERGQWILAEYEDSACEYALTGVLDNEVVRVVLDRTFIDKDGVRWIIDYKTGQHKGGSVDEFLDREKDRYLDQMETYRQLMSIKDESEVRLGLYFPQLKGWREL
jgi:ATP-dependent exoDNAse (exonuclease V) beta subunit